MFDNDDDQREVTYQSTRVQKRIDDTLLFEAIEKKTYDGKLEWKKDGNENCYSVTVNKIQLQLFRCEGQYSHQGEVTYTLKAIDASPTKAIKQIELGSQTALQRLWKYITEKPGNDLKQKLLEGLNSL